jgi:FMN phosphatase YigB (HAD superfamily)
MLKLFWSARQTFGWSIFINPYVLYNVYLILKNKGLAEPLFEAMARRHRLLASMKPLFIKMIDCQIINKPVVDAIKMLKTHGYKVYLATNLWTALVPDFQKLFPDIVSLFESLYFPSQENGNLYKPDPEYYLDFMRRYSVVEDIVFVDDDRANIKAARQVGWKCILYKHAHDFKKQIDSFLHNS